MTNRKPRTGSAARLTPARITLFLSILIAAIVLAALALDLHDKRRQVLDSARQQAQAIADGHARLILDHLGHVDGVLAQLAVRWNARELLHEDGEQSVHDLLRNHRSLLPDATELLLVDNRGRVVAAANTLLGDIALKAYCPALAALRQPAERQGLVAYRPELRAQCPASAGLIYLKPVKRNNYAFWLFLLPIGFDDGLDEELQRFSATARFRIVDAAGTLLLAGGAASGQGGETLGASAKAVVPGGDIGVEIDYQPGHILDALWWPQVRFSVALALGLLFSWALAAFFIVRTVRQYQASLAASEQHYRTLADSGSALIWTADTDTLRTYFNQPWLRFTGRRLEQELGKGWTEGVHPEDLDRCLQIYVSHFEQRQPFSMDYRLRDADGSYRWIRDDGLPRHDRDGRFIGYIGYCYDITAQKEVAQALQDAQAEALEAQREGRLAALNQMEDANLARRAAEAAVAEQQVLTRRITNLLEGMSDGFVSLDRNWRYQYVNRRGGEFLGRDAASLIGKHIWTEFPEGVGQPFHRAYERAMNEGVMSRLEEHYEPWGLWFENRIYPTQDGIAIFFTDITERKKMEDELRRSEARYRELFEHNPAPMLVYARDGLRLLAANEAFCRHYGYTQDEALALRLTDLYAEHEKQRIADLIPNLAGYAYVGEWQHLKKDGSGISIEARSHDIDFRGHIARIAVLTDISERKAAEELLRASEERFRNLAENSADWIWALDVNGRHSYSNPNIGAILGYTAEEFLALDPVNLVHPDDLGLFGATFEGACASRTGWRNVVIRWRHRDGGYRLLESSAAPVVDARGKLQGFQGVDRDITERVQAEQERVRLASILEATTDIVSMADPQGNLIYLNGPGRAVMGIAPEAALPEVIAKVHPQWAADLILGEGLPAAIRDGVWLGETAVLGAGGLEIPVSQVILSHKDEQGQLLFLSTIMRDIRASRAAEQAVRDSEERLRLALTAARQGLYDLDLTTGDAAVSPEYATMLGYDPASFRETNAAWRERLHPDDEATVYKAFEDYVGGRVPEYRVEFRQRTRDGNWKWVLSLGRIQERAADGRPLRMLGTHTDIDAIKAAEAALRELNAGLEARVAERTAELVAANRELESFAYAVSHDLRAPLRAMSGFSQALQEDYGRELRGEAKKYLDQIALAARRMSELIDGLLSLSRSTRSELRHDHVDVSALARRRLAELAAAEPGRRVKVEVADGLFARGDERMLATALTNLIDNAWKYTVKTPAPAIRVYSGEVAGRHGICIRDNGAGFDMAHAARLFQPFQRLHRQDEFVGIGIGLATVQRIVHRHGGEIVAHAAPGQGATFCIALPEPSGGSEEESPS